MNNIGKQFLLLAIIFQSVSLYCQTPQLNLDKYWNYRNSLFEKFIVDCDPANLPSGQTANGINIPATVYNPTGDGTNEYSVSWGDATIELAHYIMALAGKTNQPDPLSPKQTDHWKPGSIDPLLFDKNSKELFLSQRA